MNTPYLLRNAINGKRQRLASSSYKRGQYRLTMEPVAHDKHHYNLPKQPEDWRLSHTEKEIYLTSLFEGVQAVHDATPESKRRLIEARTGLAHVTSELREALKDLLDPRYAATSQHGTVNMVNDQIFIKTRPQLLDALGKPIRIDDSNASLSWDVRERARFYTFHVVVNGKQAFTGNQAVQDRVHAPRQEMDVGISLPAIRQCPPYGGSNWSYSGYCTPD